MISDSIKFKKIKRSSLELVAPHCLHSTKATSTPICPKVVPKNHMPVTVPLRIMGPQDCLDNDAGDNLKAWFARQALVIQHGLSKVSCG